MTSTTMRVSIKAHQTFSQLAADTGCSIAELADKAAELLRRQHIFDQAAAAYDDLYRDRDAHQAWKDELTAWDGTLDDGLVEY